MREYDFPLSPEIKEWITDHIRLGALVSDAYDRVLRLLGLRTDFIDDILSDFDNYQARFRRDVTAMNEFVLQSGLPPLIGMVVNHYPGWSGRAFKAAMAAEGHLRDGGATVISSEPFFRRYGTTALVVSRWEGHPNEVAHYVWGRMIERGLRDSGFVGHDRR